MYRRRLLRVLPCTEFKERDCRSLVTLLFSPGQLAPPEPYAVPLPKLATLLAAVLLLQGTKNTKLTKIQYMIAVILVTGSS